MPATPPLDTIGSVLDVVRARVNDVIQTTGGQTLTDAADFTPVMVNAAWRVLQNRLRAIGYTGFAKLKDDLVISALTLSASADPAVQNYIDWTGFFDGVTLNTGKVLPQEFLSPLVLWERPNGINANFRQIDPTLNGIPTNGAKQSRNLNWEWRNDRIYFPGTTITWDLRVRCLTLQPDFTDPIDPTQTVPIVDCLDPFASLIAKEFCDPRGDVDAKLFDNLADAGIAAMYSRNTAQATAISKPSDYGKMRNQYTPGAQPPNPQMPQGGQ